MEKVADLHLHTTLSDGTASTSEVIETAQERGLEAIALTDHDNYHDGIQAPLEVVDGMDVISGIELRVESQDLDQRVDILGYGVKPSRELDSVLSKIRTNRRKRAEHMLDLIEDETGTRPDLEPTDNTGRPDIARAIESSDGIQYGYEGAFENLIGNGEPCYVSRDIPNFEYGARLLKKDCNLVSLAHPYRYRRTREVVKLSRHLDGIECLYDYSSSVSREEDIDILAANYYDLTITGGSDAHEPQNIGSTGLTEPTYRNFLKSSGLSYLSQFE